MGIGTSRAGRCAVAAVVVAVLGSPSTRAQPAAPDVTPPSRAAVLDRQILNVVQLVNNGEVRESDLAWRRAKDARVTYFAALVVAHHTDLGQRGEAVSLQARIALVTSSASEQMRLQAYDEMLRLSQAADDAFDRHYIDGVIDGHERLLRQLDRELIPNARDPALRNLLRDLRYTVSDDLVQARALRKDLES